MTLSSTDSERTGGSDIDLGEKTGRCMLTRVASHLCSAALIVASKQHPIETYINSIGMSSLRDRLFEVWAPALFAKVRDALPVVSCSPRRKALPSNARPPPLRQLSIGSAIAAYRKANAEGRLLTSRESLLGACIEAVVAGVSCNPQRYGAQLAQLPPDLAQLVLDALIAAAALSDATARCFRGLCIFELRLQSYPGMRSAWLADFACAQLRIADLRGCSKVTSTPATHDKTCVRQTFPAAADLCT